MLAFYLSCLNTGTPEQTLTWFSFYRNVFLHVAPAVFVDNESLLGDFSVFPPSYLIIFGGSLVKLTLSACLHKLTEKAAFFCSHWDVWKGILLYMMRLWHYLMLINVINRSYLAYKCVLKSADLTTTRLCVNFNIKMASLSVFVTVLKKCLLGNNNLYDSGVVVICYFDIWKWAEQLVFSGAAGVMCLHSFSPRNAWTVEQHLVCSVFPSTCHFVCFADLHVGIKNGVGSDQ